MAFQKQQSFRRYRWLHCVGVPLMSSGKLLRVGWTQKSLGKFLRARLDPKIVRKVDVPRLDPKVVGDPFLGQRVSETQHDHNPRQDCDSCSIITKGVIMSLCCSTRWYVTVYYHQASLKHSAGWNRQQILQQTCQDITASRVSNLQSSGWIRERQKSSHTAFEVREDSGRSVLTRSGKSTETVSSQIPNNVCTKAQARGKRPRKESGRSGLSSCDRCWRIHPHQLVHCWEHSPATSNFWEQAAEIQH